MTRRDRIASSFNRASATYNDAAQLQTLAAQALAAQILSAPPHNPRALEVGCGTGGLTHLLLPRLPGHWIVTDIAPAMIDSLRQRFPTLDAQLRSMDGEAPDLPPESLDLIVSNLAAQWFEDLSAGLARLGHCLKSQGRMVVTTLGRASLEQWKNAVAAIGHQAGTPAYPTAEEVRAMLPGASVTANTLTMTYGNAGEFLKSLRTIGATVPAKGYQPLPTPILRQAMTQLGAPCSISYEILTLDWTKP